MTRARREILAILRAAASPLSAVEVIRSFPGGTGPDQATVYRALHWLEDGGYAESFVLHCLEHGTERYYAAILDESGRALAHRHWFHCVSCHRFTDLGECGLEGLIAGYENDLGVKINAHTLYCTGVCGPCAKSGALHGPSLRA